MLKLLDLFCGEGGAGEGYARAEFDVTGVDIRPQRRYPHRFIQADALDYLSEHWEEYDVVHASPPCRSHTKLKSLTGIRYFDFIPRLRELLRLSQKPYIIENVEGAPLRKPLLLCGAMFGLRTYRHRLFESNLPLTQPAHPKHKFKTVMLGRDPQDWEFVTLAGHFANTDLARQIMGMPWASRDGVADAIPPVYTQYIGQQVQIVLRIIETRTVA